MQKKESGIAKTKKVIIITGIVVIILFVIVLSIFFRGYSSAKQKYENVISDLEAEVERLSDPIVQHEIASREIGIDLIESEIQDIGELATVEYLYTDAGKFEDPKQLFGIDIPFTTKSFIAKWDGIIKAGIKVEEISVEINETDKQIIIHMPKAVILSHEIDDSSIETLDEQGGLFNPVKVDDVREFDAISKNAMEQRAIEKGILDKADENAKAVIEKIVKNDAVIELGYEIIFEEKE